MSGRTPNDGEGEWRTAVRMASRLADTGDPAGRRRLDVLADRLWTWALDGQPWAVAEIGNRLDGRPAQALTLSGDVRVTAVAEFLAAIARGPAEPLAIEPPAEPELELEADPPTDG